MGCNTSKGGVHPASGNGDGWTLVRSLSRSWSMPHYSAQQAPPESFHAAPLTSRALDKTGTNLKSLLEEEDQEEFEEEEGPGEVIDPSPIRVQVPGSNQRVRVDHWEQNKKRRKRTYAKSASLPHIPSVFKPERELVHGLPLVLEEKSPTSSNVNVLQKSTEKPRTRPPLAPTSSGVRKGLFYGASLVNDDESRSLSVKVCDASSSGYHTPLEQLSPASCSALEDEGWYVINRKLVSSGEVMGQSQVLRAGDCLRDKTNETASLRSTSSSLSRSLLDGFEKKCPPGGQNKVVFYFTSLQGIRKTYEQCKSVRMILEGLFTRIDERDVSMHADFRQELRSLVGCGAGVPRLFIKGRYIGGVEEVMQLNESGMIRQMVEGIPKERMKKRCAGCGGVRFIPCLECSGSCKLVGDDNQTVRCWDCNENGLVRCPVCCSD